MSGQNQRPSTCTVDGCERPHCARGWCRLHWNRWRRRATTDPLPSVEERFWAKVNKDGPIPEHRPELGPCWLWTAQTNGGHGMFKWPGGRYAHRFAYGLLVGPIPEGLTIDHLCRVRNCVKTIADESGPGHLEPVTMVENLRRGIGPQLTRERHAAKTHCKRGHPLNGVNTYVDRRGRRSCIACHRVASLKHYHARKST